MHLFKLIIAPFLNLDPGAAAGGGAAAGNGDPNAGAGTGKMFTQEEVDRIVGERLSREKGKFTDHDEILQMVKQFGYEGATPAEIKAQLKAELDTRNKQQQLNDLQKEAEKTGTSPELLAEIRELKNELSDLKQEKQAREKEVETRKAADEAWNKQVSDFKEKHPDVDMEKLSENPKFIRYLQNTSSSIPLVDRYEAFLELTGDAEAAAIAKIQANVNRSTASGKSKGDPAGGTYGLSDHQQQLARDNGMTFKEYSELLEHVRKPK